MQKATFRSVSQAADAALKSTFFLKEKKKENYAQSYAETIGVIACNFFS